MTIPVVDCFHAAQVVEAPPPTLRISCSSAAEIPLHADAVQRFIHAHGGASLGCDLRWLGVLQKAFGHTPWLLQANIGDEIVGALPLAFVRSLLFGRYLVGLPYLSTGGVRASDGAVASALLDRAMQLADELNVRHLELRHEAAIAHERLTGVMTSKVHMRLPLPDTAERLWAELKAKVRNQIRKAEQHPFEVCWGRQDLLPEFYDVFSRNMRDLGTPVYGRRLFREVLGSFVDEAELCVVRLEGQPVAAALLLHGAGVTEVPSASSLRAFNNTNANMLMYWHLLCRAIERGPIERGTLERGQRVFDFGRSSEDSGTCRFKRQWGAEPEPAAWQYYVRRGEMNQMRPDSGKYDRLIRVWSRLPLLATRLLGPAIVRGIP
jgi:FemAB-related protein (PEP-CTERM system-associated)